MHIRVKEHRHIFGALFNCNISPARSFLCLGHFARLNFDVVNKLTSFCCRLDDLLAFSYSKNKHHPHQETNFLLEKPYRIAPNENVPSFAPDNIQDILNIS